MRTVGEIRGWCRERFDDETDGVVERGREGATEAMQGIEGRLVGRWQEGTMEEKRGR